MAIGMVFQDWKGVFQKAGLNPDNYREFFMDLDKVVSQGTDLLFFMDLDKIVSQCTDLLFFMDLISLSVVGYSSVNRLL